MYAHIVQYFSNHKGLHMIVREEEEEEEEERQASRQTVILFLVEYSPYDKFCQIRWTRRYINLVTAI